MSSYQRVAWCLIGILIAACGTSSSEPSEPVWGIAGQVGIFGDPGSSSILKVEMQLDGVTVQSVSHTSPVQQVILLLPETLVSTGSHSVTIVMVDQVPSPVSYTFVGGFAAVNSQTREQLVYDVNREKNMVTGDTLTTTIVVP